MAAATGIPASMSVASARGHAISWLEPPKTPHFRCPGPALVGSGGAPYAFLRKQVLRTKVPFPSRTSISSSLEVSRMFL